MNTPLILPIQPDATVVTALLNGSNGIDVQVVTNV
jgi:hypothetical protein